MKLILLDKENPIFHLAPMTSPTGEAMKNIERKVYLRDIQLIEKPVKPKKLSTIVMTPITRVPKHLIKKEIKDHVIQKNLVVK